MKCETSINEKLLNLKSELKHLYRICYHKSSQEAQLLFLLKAIQEIRNISKCLDENDSLKKYKKFRKKANIAVRKLDNILNNDLSVYRLKSFDFFHQKEKQRNKNEYIC